MKLVPLFLLAVGACAPVTMPRQHGVPQNRAWPERVARHYVTSEGWTDQIAARFHRAGDGFDLPIYLLISERDRACPVTIQVLAATPEGDTYSCAWRTPRA